MPPSVNNTGYNVELRDKAGNNKGYLTPWVQDPSWEWLRKGGCGRCRFNLALPYRAIKFSAGDDIQIRMPGKLVYRGYVVGVTPMLGIPQSITLDINGYSSRFQKLAVHDNSGTKTYTNMLVSDIVDDIVDTFITPDTPVTKGTIDVSTFTVDSIQFKTSVEEALRTLADLEGNIEYGVDENLVFFWRTQSETLRKKFIVGDNIENFERRVDWSKLINRIHFQGGDVDGSPFIMAPVNALDSQARYYVASDFITNTSIITSSVATQYLNAKIRDSARAQLALRWKVPNTDLRLEDIVPIGKIAVYDPDYDQTLWKWGTTANGGDNIIWGKKENGGSEAIWGGTYKNQIDRIAYTLSNTINRFNLEITMGGYFDEGYAKINQIEALLSNLRQK